MRHRRLLVVVLLLALPSLAERASAADAAFSAFIATLWPDAEAAGVSRAAFERETRGLEPDLSLPDLLVPGRPETGAPAQPEFVRPPADYIKEATIARLADQGQILLRRHRDVLDRIEARFGVPAPMVLAIWGRETDYGRSPERFDALRVVATQAYLGRRKAQYRAETVLALKLLATSAVTRADFRASWAGATGLTQFLPSEYERHGVDFDGDSRVDIWHSVPDALASAAKQLADKGWQRGTVWAYEVRAPAGADCTQAVPRVQRPIDAWLDAGFALARPATLTPSERAEQASLLQPEGIYGPAFLVTRNYFVLKTYNISDLYVLFVGHLADRLQRPTPFATRWSATALLKTASVEAMQRHLTRLGFYRDTIDGKAGMLTRAALGAYQKSANLKVDCWPSETVLRALEADQ